MLFHIVIKETLTWQQFGWTIRGERRPLITQSVSTILNLVLSRPSCVRHWVSCLHKQRKPRLGILHLHSTTVWQSTIATTTVLQSTIVTTLYNSFTVYNSDCTRLYSIRRKILQTVRKIPVFNEADHQD